MKVLFFLGHPAHFHLFKQTINELRGRGHELRIVIKSKDVLEALVQSQGWEFDNIYPEEREHNRAAIAFSLMRRTRAMIRICARFGPDLMIGTSAEIAQAGWWRRRPSVVLQEDDCEVIPDFCRFAYPFCTRVMTPRVCRTGRWEQKTLHYDGYHELAYLHPNRFEPDEAVYRRLITRGSPELDGSRNPERYFILRLCGLTAFHDVGVSGIPDDLARRIIDRLRSHGRVYITSERPLDPELEKHKLSIDTADIHHAVYYADMVIGDSQTMAAEAAVLGTPSLRFSDFAGRLRYLEELEHKYQLTCGIPASEPEKLLARIDRWAGDRELKKEYADRRHKMLDEKIDVAALLTWFVDSFPQSVQIMQQNEEFGLRFK